MYIILKGLMPSLSKEVRGSDFEGDDTFRVRHSLKELWLPAVCGLKLQDGGNVAAPVAVVGGRPDSDQSLVKHVLDAFMHQLVCPTDQFQVVQVHELVKGNTTQADE